MILKSYVLNNRIKKKLYIHALILKPINYNYAFKDFNSNNNSKYRSIFNNSLNNNISKDDLFNIKYKINNFLNKIITTLYSK